MKSFTPKFGTPEQIAALCEDMQKFEVLRGSDRALINDQFNGAAPFSLEEAARLRVEFNVNFNEGGKILDDANRQVNGALIYKPRLCTLKPTWGPVFKRAGWGEEATKLFNDALQRGRSGRRMMYLLRNRNASVTLHGIGALIWTNAHAWLPRFVALADLLIPTDTNCDHEDMPYFATNFTLTQAELLDMVGGDDPDPGWNKQAVFKILHHLQKTSTRYQDVYNPFQEPEKWMEWRKQNRGVFYSAADGVPKVYMRAFYFRNPSNDSWYRKVVLRYDAYSGGQSELRVIADETFLFESEKPFADSLGQLLHIQYGDASRVPPLKHHSVRGLGVELFAPVQAMNRLRCQFMQHVFINLLTWFRITDPADRDRLKHFILEQFAAVPNEMQIIPASERYSLDPDLVDMAQRQIRQIMNESSSAFVRDIDSTSNKEMTLGEAQIRMQQVTVQISSMLKSMYAQEVFLYDETLRRFLIPGSTNPVVKEFQDGLRRKQFPKELLSHENWQTDVETVLGAGDQTVAQMQADRLLQQTPWMDPERARLVQREWITVTTGDPAKAELLMPESPDTQTSGTIAAQNLFATLMQGVPVQPREGIDHAGYVSEILALVAQKVAQIRQLDNMGTIAEALGLTNAINDAENHVKMLARDPRNKQQVKQFGDAIKELLNVVKGFAQRASQANAANGQEPPEISYQTAPESIRRQMEAKAGFVPATEPVTDPKMLKAQHSIAVKQALFAQKQTQDQIAFEMEQARKQLEGVTKLSQEAQAERLRTAFESLDRAQQLIHQNRMDTAKEQAPVNGND